MRRRVPTIGVAAAVLIAAATPARAEPGPPPPLDAVRLEQRVGARIPLDLPFTEAGGGRVRLGDFFGDGKPVLMILGYVRCSMLCSLVLRGAVRAVVQLDLVPGKDFRIVTVSIDPSEESAVGAARRRELVAQIGWPRAGAAEARERWTYLVGAERPIRALADALGFGYAWDERTEQYAHPSVVFVLAPDGTIVRSLQGIDFDPGELGAALRAAARGDVPASSPVAEAILSCFRFDPAQRVHREQIRTYLRVGASVVSVSLLSLVIALFLWERRRSRRS